MKLMTIAPKTLDTKDMLEVLDQLRAQIESGQTVAFAAVTIEPNDACRAWFGAGTSVSHLRMQGGIAQLMHNFLNGDV